MKVRDLSKLGPLMAVGVLGSAMVIMAVTPAGGENSAAPTTPAVRPAGDTTAAFVLPRPEGGAAPAAAAGAEPKWPEVATITKDMETVAGLITLYHYKSDDSTKDQARLLAKIPRSLMKQDLLLATSFSRGEMAGFQGNEYLIRFEIVGKNVVINTPNVRIISSDSKQVSADLVKRTYGDSFLAALPILTMEGSDPIVDIGSTLMDSTLAGMGMRARRDLSGYSKLKSFPENTLIEVDLAVNSSGGGGERMGVFYALRKLPDARSYTPRAADERVGYFTTVRQDWGVKHTERDITKRYINRWDIKKKDPSLELSPPDQPIVFVVERTVPDQWRPYVTAAIREWNKAFEKLGIVEAVVVQQQTDDNEFANVDPEDARYNFFRWIVTGSAFAMGPSRADPRTGQILDADIIFDDSFVRVLERNGDIFGIGPASAVFGPELAEFMTQHPEYLPPGQSVQDIKVQQDPVSEWMAGLTDMSAEGMVHRFAQDNMTRSSCGYASGLQHQLAFANFAAAAATRPAGKKQIPDRLMGEILKEIVTHEVGHTLGLRHNFKGSAWLSLEDMKKRRDSTDEATSASVMDYNAVLYLPGDDPTEVKHLMTPCIGPYDFWAIEYGYKTPGKEDGPETGMLAKIASKCNQRELAYGTDEDTMGLTSPDPGCNRYDVGEDPLAWAKARAQLCNTLLKDIKKWAVKADEPNEYLRRTFEIIMREKAYNMFYAARTVGGQYVNRTRAGDANAKPIFELLSPQKQREVIATLTETVFSDDYFATDPELVNDLGPSRWSDWATPMLTRVDYPLHQVIGTLQSYSLMCLCMPQALQRVYDAELKSKNQDKFTAAELIMSVRKAVWGDLSAGRDKDYSDSAPMICSVRRNLQAQHLRYLLATADSSPGLLVSIDLQNMVRFALRDLGDQIGRTLDGAKENNGGSKIDFASRAHLTECKSQIDRVLNAPQIKLGGSMMMFMGQDAHRPQSQMQK